MAYLRRAKYFQAAAGYVLSGRKITKMVCFVLFRSIRFNWITQAMIGQSSPHMFLINYPLYASYTYSLRSTCHCLGWCACAQARPTKSCNNSFYKVITMFIVWIPIDGLSMRQEACQERIVCSTTIQGHFRLRSDDSWTTSVQESCCLG